MSEVRDRGASESSGIKITEEALDKLRRQLGKEFPLKDAYNTVATKDAIRHYALGIGDDNPRWLDPAYAEKTRWKGLIAHPTFAMTFGQPRSQGLPGIHALFSGLDMQCHAPIRLGAEVKATSSLYELLEKPGRYAGRQFKQTYETKYRDEAGQLLTTIHMYTFRTERGTATSTGKYAKIERKVWTDEELESVEADIERERELRRGGEPRFFDSVKIGDSMGPIVKGPLTVTDCICFLMGFGYIFVRAHRQGHEFRKLHPKAGIKNSYGVWDIPERVHWEEEMPTKIGMPGPYDYGNQRVAWFDHAIHDWMGDDGWLKRLRVRVSGPNFVGDVTWIRGKVVALDPETSSVTVEMESVDQRGRVHATSIADVVLPSR